MKSITKVIVHNAFKVYRLLRHAACQVVHRCASKLCDQCLENRVEHLSINLNAAPGVARYAPTTPGFRVSPDCMEAQGSTGLP
jgi:hypothetical protein